MPQLTASLQARTPGMLSSGMRKRAQRFVHAEEAARRAAAAQATSTSRRAFTRRRDLAPPRPGRSSTGGRMEEYLQWKPLANDSVVALDVTSLDRAAPHWIIQEIGTGQRATLRTAGQVNPRGRPRRNATYVRTVRPQRGRRIRSGLVFASGGRYSPTRGGIRSEQLHWASQVGAPWRAPAITIDREIKGQHFAQRGGEQGFRQYRSAVLSAARQAFNKRSAP